MDALELSRSCVITWGCCPGPGSPPEAGTPFLSEGEKKESSSLTCLHWGLPSPPAMLTASMLLHPSPTFHRRPSPEPSSSWSGKYMVLQAHSRHS